MKHILCLICLLFSINIHTQAQSIGLLQKHQLFDPPEDQMIVMDKHTFGKYHYTASQYDTLKQEVNRLDSVIVQRDSLQSELIQDFSEVLKSKNAEIQAYQGGYNSMRNNLNTCIDQQNKLQADYLKLQQHHRRAKKWRNIFFGSSVVLTGIIVLMVMH